MKSITLIVALLALAGAAAAQPGQTDAGGNNPNTGGGATQTSSVGSGASDANLAAMIKTINDSEIKESKLAEKRAQSKAVKSFARMMVRDHTQNNNEVAQVSKRIGLQPQADDVTVGLRQAAKDNVRTLEGQNGSGFDSAYIDQMVKDHELALQKLDDALSGNSGRNEQLDGLLKKTRQAVSDHLDEARKVQAQLGSGAQRSPESNGSENKSGY